MSKVVTCILIGAGIAVVGVAAGAVVSHLITKSLVNVAVGRDIPKSLEKQRPKITQGDRVRNFQERIDKTGKALLEKDIEEIKISSRDGLRLVGHWYPCENAKRIIVARHGWRSAWHMDFGMIADFWHSEGCSILFAEQRAQNNSEGEYMTFGYMERYDCLDWVNFVNERTEQQYPIYIAGVSMGASTVLMTAGLDLPENVKGVVADCGYTSAYAIWRHVVKDNMRLSYGLREKAIDMYCKKHIGATSREITTIEAMKKTKLPILFIHGSDDTFVPVEMSFENYKACSAPKHLLVIPGAIHGQSYDVEQEKYEEATRRFWTQYDDAEV